MRHEKLFQFGWKLQKKGVKCFVNYLSMLDKFKVPEKGKNKVIGKTLAGFRNTLCKKRLETIPGFEQIRKGGNYKRKKQFGD